MRLLKRFAGETAAAWFATYQFSATYGVFSLPESLREVVGELPLSSFFHIGFSNDNRDVYFKSGIHSAPERIASVIRSFERAGCAGFHSYNESFGDHLNVYLSSRLARNPGLDTRGLLREYVATTWGLAGADAEAVGGVLEQMQFLDDARASGWSEVLREVAARVRLPPRQPWAFEHLRLKAELLALDHAIESGTDWSSPRSVDAMLPAMSRRIEMTEQMMREVYGLGVLSHAFIEDRMMPAWYAAQRSLHPVPEGMPRPGARLGRDA